MTDLSRQQNKINILYIDIGIRYWYNKTNKWGICRKEDTMATSTFDKSFVIKKAADKERVLKVVNSEEPVRPIRKPPYTQKERDRSVELLKQCLFRSET